MADEFFYNTNHMTVPIEEYLRQCDSFEQFEDYYLNQFLQDDDRVGQYLQSLLHKYEKDYATVSTEAGLHRSYVGNIVHGRKNNPGRDALIAICLTIGTTIDEAQYLLKYAGHAPLYVRRKRDVIIWFAFMKKKPLDELDDDLYARGYATLRRA